MSAHNVKLRLDAWRDAERRRDGLALGSAEWHQADVEVRNAQTTFRAELAQVSARYAEEQFQHRNSSWSAQLDRRISGRVDGPGLPDALVARLPPE